MTTRTINAMITGGESIGRYVYAKTPSSIATESWPRITKARMRDGVIQVKELSTGRWVELIDNGLVMQ